MGAQWKQAGRELNAQKRGQMVVKLVREAADNRRLVEHPRRQRQHLADRRTGKLGRNRLVRPTNLRRRKRLGIKRLELARPASQRNLDLVDKFDAKGEQGHKVQLKGSYTASGSRIVAAKTTGSRLG